MAENGGERQHSGAPTVRWKDLGTDALCRTESAANGPYTLITTVSDERAVMRANVGWIWRRSGANTWASLARTGDNYEAVATPNVKTQRVLIEVIADGQPRTVIVRYLVSNAGLAIATVAWLLLGGFALWWLLPLGTVHAIAGLGASILAFALLRVAAWWKPQLQALGELARIWELAIPAALVFAGAIVVVPPLVFVHVNNVSIEPTARETKWWFDVPDDARPGRRGIRFVPTVMTGKPPPDAPDPIKLETVATGCTGELLAPSEWRSWHKLAFDHDVVQRSIDVRSGTSDGPIASLQHVECSADLVLPLNSGQFVNIDLGGLGRLECKATATHIVALSIEPPVKQLVVRSENFSTWTGTTTSNTAYACVSGPSIDVSWTGKQRFSSLHIPATVPLKTIAINSHALACDHGVLRAIATVDLDPKPTRDVIALNGKSFAFSALDDAEALLCDPPSNAYATKVDYQDCHFDGIATLSCTPVCFIAGKNSQTLITHRKGCHKLGTRGLDGVLHNSVNDAHPQCARGDVFSCP